MIIFTTIAAAAAIYTQTHSREFIYFLNAEELTPDMHRCHICGFEFPRRDNLSRHLKRKYPCDGQNRKVDQYKRDRSSINELNHMRQSESMNTREIPTFDGAEFSGEKLISSDTLDKLMEMQGIPVKRREEIKREEIERSTSE